MRHVYLNFGRREKLIVNMETANLSSLFALLKMLCLIVSKSFPTMVLIEEKLHLKKHYLMRYYLVSCLVWVRDFYIFEVLKWAPRKR